MSSLSLRETDKTAKVVEKTRHVCFAFLMKGAQCSTFLLLSIRCVVSILVVACSIFVYQVPVVGFAWQLSLVVFAVWTTPLGPPAFVTGFVVAATQVPLVVVALCQA